MHKARGLAGEEPCRPHFLCGRQGVTRQNERARMPGWAEPVARPLTTTSVIPSTVAGGRASGEQYDATCDPVRG